MPFNNATPRKKPAFLRKSEEPMPPSDGAEDADEMATDTVTCPECGHAFDPADAESDD